MDSNGRKRPRSVPEKLQAASTVDTKLQELHLLCDLMTAQDVADLAGKILQHVNQLGFSDFSYMRMDGKNLIQDKLRTTSVSLSENYYKEKFWLDDMMMQYAAANVTPIFQTDINQYLDRSPFKTESIQRNLDLRKMVHGEGYVEYYNIPVTAIDGSGNILFSLTSRHVTKEKIQANARKNGLLCQLLATAIDSVMTTKSPHFYVNHEGSVAVKICPKPLLLLTQMARTGLNVKRASHALNMSEDTVNKHIRAAKDALGAKTTAHAVYLAIQRGLICCDE
jgi:hypothetical protein